MRDTHTIAFSVSEQALEMNETTIRITTATWEGMVGIVFATFAFSHSPFSFVVTIAAPLHSRSFGA